MVNTGTWNSDFSIILLMIFFSPVILYFILGVYLRIEEIQSNDDTFTQIYVQPTVQYSATQEPVKSKPATKPPIKPKPKTEPDAISLDAISGLIGLGYKKSEARRLVAIARSQKHYEKAEDIIMDTMANCV